MAPDSGNPRAVIGATHLGSPAAAQEAPALPPSIALAGAGRTEHFEVSYDESFGETGLAVASTVLDRCERDLTTMREWFGAARRRLVDCRRPHPDAGDGSYRCRAGDGRCSADHLV